MVAGGGDLFLIFAPLLWLDVAYQPTLKFLLLAVRGSYKFGQHLLLLSVDVEMELPVVGLTVLLLVINQVCTD